MAVKWALFLLVIGWDAVLGQNCNCECYSRFADVAQQGTWLDEKDMVIKAAIR